VPQNLPLDLLALLIPKVKLNKDVRVNYLNLTVLPDFFQQVLSLKDLTLCFIHYEIFIQIPRFSIFAKTVSEIILK